MNQEQVEYASHLVARMIIPTEAIRMMEEKFKLNEHDARCAYKAGKRLLRRWLSRSPERHHLESAAFYRSMIQRQDVEPRDQLKARQLLDRSLGVERPLGEPDDREVSVEEVIKAVNRIIERYQDQPDEPRIVS